MISNDEILPDNMNELMMLIKSKAGDDTSPEEMFALCVACSFDCNGETNDGLIDEMIDYIKANPELRVKEIFDHLESLLPPIEIVDDDDFDDGESA